MCSGFVDTKRFHGSETFVADRAFIKLLCEFPAFFHFSEWIVYWVLDCNFVYSQRNGKKRVYSVNEETISALFRAVEIHAEKYCPTGGKCFMKDR